MTGQHFFRYSTGVLFATHCVLALVGYFWILPSAIPLWYSFVRPEDQLAPKVFVFLFPGLTLLFLILHNALASQLKQHETALQVLWFGTVSSIVFITIAFLRILVLVS